MAREAAQTADLRPSDPQTAPTTPPAVLPSTYSALSPQPSAALRARFELCGVLYDVPLDLNVASHGSDPTLEQRAHLASIATVCTAVVRRTAASLQQV